MDEAPCPSLPGETPFPFYNKMPDERDKKMTEIKSSDIYIDNKKYIFELGKSENKKNIIFKVYEKKNHIISNYIAHINFNQFKNINQLFDFYGNIDEIYKLLAKLIDTRKYSISLSDNEYKITFDFTMPGEKIIKVEFYLKEEKVSNTMVMSDIYNILDNLEEENNTIKEEIKKLKNEDKQLKDDLEGKNKEISALKNELNEVKKENKLIQEKMKLLEEKVNNMPKGNVIIKENNDLKKEIKDNKKEYNIHKNEIKPDNKPEYKSVHNQYEYNSVPSQCSSVPNQFEYKPVPNDKKDKFKNIDNNIINDNKLEYNMPKNIIIDEEEEEVEEVIKNDIKEKVEEKKEEKVEEKKEEIKEEKKEEKVEEKNDIKNQNQKVKDDTGSINKDLNLSKKHSSSPLIKKKEEIDISKINFDELFTNSKIISKKKEKVNLYKWLSSKGGRISEIKLIFQSSKDGDDYKTFFEKCGEKGPTLILIKSKRKKKFGGFSTAEWTDKKGKIQIKDESAFVYSLDKLEKYDVLKPEIAVVCYPTNFIIMYGNGFNRYGLRIPSKFLEKGSYENFDNRSYDTPDKYCLNGESEFNVDELEVFQIIFE